MLLRDGEKGKGCRSLAQDIWSQTQLGLYITSYCAVDSDYKPSASDPQHISIHLSMAALLSIKISVFSRKMRIAIVIQRQESLL
jgi:hypothetical protein